MRGILLASTALALVAVGTVFPQPGGNDGVVGVHTQVEALIADSTSGTDTCSAIRTTMGRSHGLSQWEQGQLCVQADNTSLQAQPLFKVDGSLANGFDYPIVRVCTVGSVIGDTIGGNGWGNYPLSLALGGASVSFDGSDLEVTANKRTLRCDDFALEDGVLTASMNDQNASVFVYGTWSLVRE